MYVIVVIPSFIPLYINYTYKCHLFSELRERRDLALEKFLFFCGGKKSLKHVLFLTKCVKFSVFLNFFVCKIFLFQ